MIDGILTIFEKFPFTKWLTVIGVLLLFFGDKDWKVIGFWLIAAVAVFMLVIVFMVMEIDEQNKEFKRRKNRKD